MSGEPKTGMEALIHDPAVRGPRHSNSCPHNRVPGACRECELERQLEQAKADRNRAAQQERSKYLPKLIKLHADVLALMATVEHLRKCCDFDAEGNPVACGQTLYLCTTNNPDREFMELTTNPAIQYCWFNTQEAARKAKIAKQNV